MGIRENCINIHGPQLFNLLPADIKGTVETSVEVKRKLNHYLCQGLDQPDRKSVV